MKKQTLLAVSIAMFLAACSPAGENSSSTPGSEPSSSSPSSSQSARNIYIESGWPEKEAETLASIFLDHLYPYYDFAKLGYTYELTTYEGSYSMVSVNLQIADFPFEEVKNYLSAITGGTGYVDKTEDYVVPQGEYVVEKVFSDYSLISATFYISDESGAPLTEGSGKFELDIHPARIAKEAWLGGDIEDFVAEILEKEITLPAPNSPVSRYIAAVNVMNGLPTPSLYFVGSDARESYASDLASAGWKKVPLPESEIGDSLYYISPDESVRALIHLENSSDPIVTIIEFQKSDYYVAYPESAINDCLDMIFLTQKHLSLPIPDSKDIAYYQVNDVLEIGGFFEIYAYGTDCSDAYEKQLEAAGFHLVNYDVVEEQFFYGDKDEALFIYAYYKSDLGFTNITVGRNGKYYAGWPTQKINRMTESIGGETMLPVDEEATYTYVQDSTSTSGDFTLNTKNLDENHALVDTTKRYESLLNASDSGWIYDDVEERWHDAKGKLSVSLRFYEEEGLEICVEGYIPSAKELSESDLLSAFSGVGVEGYSFITVDEARGYSLITGSEDSFSIIAWGITENIFSNYQEKLTSNHSFKKVGGTDYYFDSSKKVSFTMDFDDSQRLLTIVFQSYASRFNYSAANLASYVARAQEKYDSLFTLPAIPCAESTEGILRLFEEYDVITFSVAVFETGILANLRTALANDGWKKSENSDDYFFKDGENYLWTIYLYEDAENNYTDIDITGKQ